MQINGECDLVCRSLSRRRILSALLVVYESWQRDIRLLIRVKDIGEVICCHGSSFESNACLSLINISTCFLVGDSESGLLGQTGEHYIGNKNCMQ